MLQFLDTFFIFFHTALILFNLFGWIWKKTRKANFLLLMITLFSWTILGIWYGMGYCPCTDWHWQVRRELGHYDMPASYVKFLLDYFTGQDINPALIDAGTVLGLVLALVASTYTNFKKYFMNKFKSQNK
ncbi:MAG: DUF2784 domain-containing protein [Cyclobacteriaceae bacterium]|nr:DUF2784 domain-containing protein [Cyclobacteriaceae bacterium]